VEATQRAWSAQQGANGTEGKDAAADMETNEHEIREKTCRESRCGANCRQALGEETQQAQAEDSVIPICCACQQRRDPWHVGKRNERVKNAGRERSADADSAGMEF